MISNIQIDKMRCFKDFILDDIGRINIIAGENNAGKTALLEAIFLLFAYNSPDLFMKVNGIRGIVPMPPTPIILWEQFFYQLTDEELNISCSLYDEDAPISLALFKDTLSSSFKMLPNEQQNIKPSNMVGYPLRLHFQGYGKSNTGYCTLQDMGFTTQWELQPIHHKKHLYYLGPKASFAPNMLSELFSTVELAGKKESLLKAIRLLDSSIDDLINVTIKGTTYIYAKQNGLALPITAKGDGINKLLHILCVMIANSGGITLIDEIENGFHYSFYPALWKTIESIARSTGGQVFATTHSYECIQDAAIALQDAEDTGSGIRFIRLGRKKGIVKPHVLAAELFTYAIDRNMEIR